MKYFNERRLKMSNKRHKYRNGQPTATFEELTYEEQAKAINVYEPVNYKKNPQTYCGMEINDNPLFDL